MTQMIDKDGLIKDLQDEMLKLYNRSKKEIGYTAPRFFMMLTDYGPLVTAQKLIHKSGGTDGFHNLWEHHRLDLSVEALILRPKYRSLFTTDELQICRDRLADYGYVVDESDEGEDTLDIGNNVRTITKVSSEEVDASETDEYVIKKSIDNAGYDDSYEKDFKYDAIPEPRIEVDNTTEPSSYYSYPRDLQKRINALRRAKFVCEFDPNHKSFISKKNNMPYMETHHLVPLEYWKSFKYSLDVEANIVCLCSNCHNEIHYGKYSSNLIRPLYEKRKDELHSAGIDIDIDSLIEMYEGDFVKDK